MNPQEIHNKLQEAYPNGKVDVTDMTGTQDHYSVYICSKAFEGLSRIKRHQHVMSVFSEELKTGEVHALTIQTDIPTNNGPTNAGDN